MGRRVHVCAGMMNIMLLGETRKRSGIESIVKKCMEFTTEGRRAVGRPRRTLLESVEAYMAELEIDKEDVHDRKKWRRSVMKRKSKSIGKRTINW